MSGDGASIIHGHGSPSSFDLSVDSVTEQTKELDLGAFVRRYEIDTGGGGSILFSSGNLTGAMYEFEKAFFVVWSCGEYIDWAVFHKGAR
jgi:hypothetical protein